MISIGPAGVLVSQTHNQAEQPHHPLHTTHSAHIPMHNACLQLQTNPTNPSITCAEPTSTFNHAWKYMRGNNVHVTLKIQQRAFSMTHVWHKLKHGHRKVSPSEDNERNTDYTLYSTHTYHTSMKGSAGFQHRQRREREVLNATHYTMKHVHMICWPEEGSGYDHPVFD